MKGATESDRIFRLLVDEASRVGDGPVHQAYKKFKNRKQRAIARGAKPERRKPIPKSWIRAAHERQKYRCAICGNPLAATAATGDHEDAHSTGGPHKPENIVAVHGACNSSKGNRTVWDDAKKRNQSALDRIKLREGS